ncbi:MAG TPA: bifunctional nuclease family protein [Oligoflexia bacterium]|nr:bifunctional nuclease family protein [Oligoflexia bacterium]HMP47967.1 bifunctional nuclease family protein [Oligoflexia bacterium]
MSDSNWQSKEGELEMVIGGLVLDPVSNSPIIVLKDPHSSTCLPIWIGVPEASSIVTALNNIDVSRPYTHDLLKESLEILGARVSRIIIVSLRDNTFYACIELVHGEMIKELDARPSDALALAIRCNAPIFARNEVLLKAQAKLVPTAPPDDGSLNSNENMGSFGDYDFSEDMNDNNLKGSEDTQGSENSLPEENFTGLNDETGKCGRSSINSELLSPKFFNLLELCQQGLSDKELQDLLINMGPDDFKYKM